jgi:gamma-glutamyl-gamma-aminobutyrate hydrolase PuuD
MKLIAVTQRIANEPDYLAGHDMLDPGLSRFLYACDCLPIILPNVVDVVTGLTQQIRFDGILLSGGNVTPERSDIENHLIEYAILNNIPMLGVCQGMQRIQKFFGLTLEPVSGHVSSSQVISINKSDYTTNSYHDYGTTLTNTDLIVFAKHHDGVVKGIKHKDHPLYGIMWHPERQQVFSSQDIDFVKKLYLGVKQCEQSY